MNETFTRSQRVILGVVSGVMLIAGVLSLYLFPQIPPALTAVLVRVGTVLGVVWLAFPQLKSVGTRLPGFAAIGLLGTLVVMAARPNLFKVAAVLVLFLLILSLLSKVFRPRN